MKLDDIQPSEELSQELNQHIGIIPIYLIPFMNFLEYKKNLKKHKEYIGIMKEYHQIRNEYNNVKNKTKFREEQLTRWLQKNQKFKKHIMP